jgi:hypothetical protein
MNVAIAIERHVFRTQRYCRGVAGGRDRHTRRALGQPVNERGEIFRLLQNRCACQIGQRRPVPPGHIEQDCENYAS